MPLNRLVVTMKPRHEAIQIGEFDGPHKETHFR